MATPRQAMLLAAGRGTRLGELGRRTAKALVEVAGEPLLARQLRYLAAQGVERVVVNASHLAEQVQEFADAHPGPPEVEVVGESEPLGTAGGVRNALPMLGPDPLLVVYGDVISDADLAPMGELHDRERPVATLAAYRSEDASQKGVLDIEDDRVTGFHEKDPARTSGWVNAGIYVVEPGWVAGFEDPDPLDFGFDLFPSALQSGQKLLAYPLPSPALDIGTPEDLAKARGTG